LTLIFSVYLHAPARTQLGIFKKQINAATSIIMIHSKNIS